MDTHWVKIEPAIEQLVGLNMIIDKNETHRVKIEPATAHHMVGVSLGAFHKPEIYLLLGVLIQKLKVEICHNLTSY